jgi:hypothetical protein
MPKPRTIPKCCIEAITLYRKMGGWAHWAEDRLWVAKLQCKCRHNWTKKTRALLDTVLILQE